jgi:rhodanese-related sulfurtransferase
VILADHRAGVRPGQQERLPSRITVEVMHPPPLPEISAAEAAEQVRAGGYLLDVRELDEWVAGHAPDAVHIPMSELSQRAAELPSDAQIICVCHVGARSAAVTDALLRGGWTAVNLAGGMAAWEEAGLPIVAGDGKPGQIV